EIMVPRRTERDLGRPARPSARPRRGDRNRAHSAQPQASAAGSPARAVPTKPAPTVGRVLVPGRSRQTLPVDLPRSVPARLARLLCPRRRRALALILIAAMTPAVYSYVTTMLQPSSVSFGVRSIEWLRDHHGRWLVNEVERVYYSLTAPTKGGPQLR